ncbi:Protein FAR1-RELATED SEQUENCE [Arachis hypogaea]|nr:Protein FAR1-RELATED SEQUENCE [Arachis hypogaea]
MYNVVRRQRAMQSGDVNATLRYFNVCARRDGNMYWWYQVGAEQNMCDLFWSDGHSPNDYKIFGDVLAFDATYRRNKYNLPVIVFSEVNHHNQTCVFGAAHRR